MKRTIAFSLGLIAASFGFAASGVAAESGAIRFTLEEERGDRGKLHADFRYDEPGNHNSNWSSGFMPSDLIGLDMAAFRSVGTRPLHFTIAREAGRLDCAGRGGEAHAWGDCSFTLSPTFARLLESRGIARPTWNEGMGLLALNVRSSLIEAVGSARYPTPTISQLMSLTAVGVTGDYISAMSGAGYRPGTIQSLVEFKAMGISPEWIGGFVRAGYANLLGNELVQLKAMNITPEYIAGFDRAGYRHLPVNTLVQLKALDITPDFVRSASAGRATMPPVNELVEMKVLGRRR